MTKYKDKWCQEAYNKGFKEGREFEKGQTEKVKELLKEFMSLLQNPRTALDTKTVMNKAEQFLKDSEVEK